MSSARWSNLSVTLGPVAVVVAQIERPVSGGKGVTPTGQSTSEPDDERDPQLEHHRRVEVSVGTGRGELRGATDSHSSNRITVGPISSSSQTTAASTRSISCCSLRSDSSWSRSRADLASSPEMPVRGPGKLTAGWPHSTIRCMPPISKRRSCGRCCSSRRLARKRGKFLSLSLSFFCSVPDLGLELQGTARSRVCLRDHDAVRDSAEVPGILAAVKRRECAGLEPNPKGTHDRPTKRMITQAMEQAGDPPVAAAPQGQ